MNLQQLRSDPTLQDERLTQDEVEAVIQLWSRRRSDQDRAAALPTLTDVAEGLEIPAEHAFRLLQEVRLARNRESELAEQERVASAPASLHPPADAARLEPAAVTSKSRGLPPAAVLLIAFGSLGVMLLVLLFSFWFLAATPVPGPAPPMAPPPIMQPETKTIAPPLRQ